MRAKHDHDGIVDTASVISGMAESTASAMDQSVASSVQTSESLVMGIRRASEILAGRGSTLVQPQEEPFWTTIPAASAPPPTSRRSSLSSLYGVDYSKCESTTKADRSVAGGSAATTKDSRTIDCYHDSYLKSASSTSVSRYSSSASGQVIYTSAIIGSDRKKHRHHKRRESKDMANNNYDNVADTGPFPFCFKCMIVASAVIFVVAMSCAIVAWVLNQRHPHFQDKPNNDSGDDATINTFSSQGRDPVTGWPTGRSNTHHNNESSDIFGEGPPVESYASLTKVNDGNERQLLRGS